MNFKFIKFGFHDTVINDIKLQPYGFDLIFLEGVYLLDDTGKETTFSAPCTLRLKIDGFDQNCVYEHASFKKIYKKHISEIDFNQFKKLMFDNRFAVDIDFYAPVAYGFLLRGYIGKYVVETFFTEIEAMEFDFQS